MAQLSEKEILNEIIIGYRKFIDERYEYKRLSKKYDLPNSFDEERVARFKDYFLDNIYPDLEQREELNEAFESLDNYIKHPEKLFRIMIDSASLIFKYGRHLRKILNAGIKALTSFRRANQFENQLVQIAITQKTVPPFSTAKIKKLISALPAEEVNQFIESTQALFTTFEDRVLIGKIKEIIQHLVAKMKKRPQTYSEVEIRGIEIGYDIIQKGDVLFEELSQEEQKIIFDFIVKIERESMSEIFNKK